MKTALILAIFIILSFYITYYIISANAYTMNNIWTWSYPPTTCIWHSDYDNLIKDELMKWEDVLFDLWGVNGIFEINIIYTDTSWDIIKNCDAHIIVNEVEYTRGSPHEPVYGRTIHVLKYDLIYVQLFEERDLTSDLFTESFKNTVLHEYGHVLGLDHWIPETAREGLKPWPKTLMWQWQDDNIHAVIDNGTILALKCFYGKDGFAGKNIGCDVFNFNLKADN